ncbi:nicotinate-nicotinamide nucleotide adenylyltransferase [Coleofasciculus sp. LEGE 07092]|nr:nicotinate-nicotinamide nucleotide adenylyltransferase [Coleofasciculus sp. LEGE 07081]MBE9151582.1 nicotinate-nicotinamide nucleotide adenylyltransferase [Coleofasciculus sp. LEGE 07092]
MGNVAILGGTFDPVHLGHLLIAQTALSQVGLERVFWVPNRHPPHKVGSLYEHRQAMVAKAIADNPIFTLPDLETDEIGIDYAFLSLQKLQKAYPNCHWYWILGLDAFKTLPIASQNISFHWQLLQMPPTGISSSLIRQYCREHRSIRYLVPESVRAYITIHNIYSN